jgi:hypothetical protein
MNVHVHAHGYGVVRAAWTGDSHFLVVSTEPSGGHQPWSRPIWVYSSAKNRIFELSKFGLVATGEFTLKEPDEVEVPIIGCEGLLAERRIFGFSLSRFLTTGRLEIPGCSGR